MTTMFEWNAGYSVQIGSVDAQHQNLFAISRELYGAMNAGQGRSVPARILKRLVRTIVQLRPVQSSEEAMPL